MFIKKRIVCTETEQMDFELGAGGSLGDALEEKIKGIFEASVEVGGRPLSIEVEWDDSEAELLHRYFGKHRDKATTKKPMPRAR